MTLVSRFILIVSLMALSGAGITEAQSTGRSPSQVQSQAQPSALAPAQSTATPAADCAELPALKDRLRSQHQQLMDWAELGRYRDADSKLAPPAKHEQRVVCLGDSITDIWSNVAKGGFSPGKPCVNRGIGGQTIPQLLVRFRQDVIALQPKVVVILAGTNDIVGNTGPIVLGETEASLSTMAELAQAHRIRVVLSSLLPVSDYGHTRDGPPLIQTKRRPRQQILELNEWLKRYAS